MVLGSDRCEIKEEKYTLVSFISHELTIAVLKAYMHIILMLCELDTLTVSGPIRNWW